MAACTEFEAGCQCLSCVKRAYRLKRHGDALLHYRTRVSLEARRAAMDLAGEQAQFAHDMIRIGSAEFLEDMNSPF